MDIKEFSQDLKLRVDPIQVVSDYVSLKKAGRRYKGLCPFHKEKSPSFTVDGETGLYYCFGCQEGGDIYSFLMRLEGITFTEAMQVLARKAGVPVPQFKSSGPTVPKEPLFKAMETAVTLYHRNLLSAAEDSPARSYLGQRGLGAKDVTHFQLGYGGTGRQLLEAAKSAKLKQADLDQAGLIQMRGGRSVDRFSGRLLFPIHDVTGRPVAMGGRIIGEGHPKYVNSPETPIYHKGSVLYNLHRAKDAIRKAGFAILVEGYMDVVGLTKHGIHNVVAPLGTALTDNQARLLGRYTKKVLINFDPDFAGLKASSKGVEVLVKAGQKVSLLTLPDGLDPFDYVERHGGEAYRDALRGATPFMDFILERSKADLDLTQASAQVEYLNRILPFLCLVETQIERLQYISKVSEKAGIEDRLVLEELKKALKARNTSVSETGKSKLIARQIKPLESNLLMHFLTPGDDQHLIDEKLNASWLESLATGTLFSKARDLLHHNGEVDSRSLAASLDDGEQALLAHALNHHESEASWQSCLETLEYEYLNRCSLQLQRDIRKAESRGDTAALEALLQEHKSLQSALAVHVSKGVAD